MDTEIEDDGKSRGHGEKREKKEVNGVEMEPFFHACYSIILYQGAVNMNSSHKEPRFISASESLIMCQMMFDRLDTKTMTREEALDVRAKKKADR